MLLVDVYNVLHTTGVLPPDLAGIDVQELAKLLLASRYGRLEIILVCDGTGGGAIDHGIDRYRQTGGSGVVRKSGGSGGAGGDRRRNRDSRRGTCAVVYAGRGMEADTVIDIMIRGGGYRGQRGADTSFGRVGSGSYGRPIVVSSDRAVRASARRARAKSVLSEDFLQQLVDDWKRTSHPGGGHITRSRPGADDRPGFARRTPLDRYTVEEWLEEFGFGADGPTQAEWDALLAELSTPAGRERTAPPERSAEESRVRATPKGETANPAGGGTQSGERPMEPAAGPPRPVPEHADPLTRAAMQAWPGRVNADDLDMDKWLEGDERLAE